MCQPVRISYPRKSSNQTDLRFLFLQDLKRNEKFEISFHKYIDTEFSVISPPTESSLPIEKIWPLPRVNQKINSSSDLSWTGWEIEGQTVYSFSHLPNFRVSSEDFISVSKEKPQNNGSFSGLSKHRNFKFQVNGRKKAIRDKGHLCPESIKPTSLPCPFHQTNPEISSETEMQCTSKPYSVFWT